MYVVRKDHKQLSSLHAVTFGLSFDQVIYRIKKVQCWTDSRHHLIDANGVVVCKTDSAMIVDMWRKQYSIDEVSK